MNTKLDLTDSKIYEALMDVQDDNSPTVYVVFGYVPRTNKLKVCFQKWQKVIVFI